MDSQDMTITYNAIQDRANDDAREAMPDMPTENTSEAWESFQSEVEAVDAYDVAHESSGWDWVIYYHRAMQLCQAVPSDVLNDAENTWEEMGAYTGDQFGLYEFASTLAAIIVEREVAEAVDTLKDELIELAENQMEQF